MTTNDMPLVSVIMPAYNQAQYIAEAIESVKAQTYSNWELAIVDDGSPDNVAEVVKKYTESDSRIKFYHTDNHGLSAARNYAVAHTSGSLIIPLDADDVFHPKYVEECVNRFKSHPETKVVYCQWKFFGAKNKTPKLSYTSYGDLVTRNSIFASAMYRREDFDRVGGYDEAMRVGWEDWDMWVRILDEDSVVYQIPRRYFRYRIKEVSMTTLIKGEENSQKLFEYVFKKHYDKFVKYHGSESLRMWKLIGQTYQIKRWRDRPLLERLWHTFRKHL